MTPIKHRRRNVSEVNPSQDLRYLRKLDDEGAPVLMNKAIKKLLKINDDLQKAMKEDMMSDDEDRLERNEDGDPIFLTDS